MMEACNLAVPEVKAEEGSSISVRMHEKCPDESQVEGSCKTPWAAIAQIQSEYDYLYQKYSQLLKERGWAGYFDVAVKKDIPKDNCAK